MRVPCRRWVPLLLVIPLGLVVVNLRLHRLLPQPQPQPQPRHEEAPLPAVVALERRLRAAFAPKPLARSDPKTVWSLAEQWPRETHVFPIEEAVGYVLHALKTVPIVRADYSRKGTQLKLVLTLEGNENVLFKPQWYNRHDVVRGSVYSGKDRHNAEVVAFYLSAILDIRWTPLAIIRRINLRNDIWEKATRELRETMFERDDGSMCLYGKCFYCRRNESVCGNSNDELEGAVIHVVKQSFNKYRSPWQRTYDTQKQAEWETNPHYCSKVKKSLPITRLLDLIDVAIFDFLLQNGDRHHYETMMNRVIFIDNGKGLGNPYKDFNDILAPLYQCCIIRHSTWKRLKLLSGGSLSDLLSEFLSKNLTIPVITDLHLQAIDRRLLTIYSTVGTCIEKYGKSIFKDK